MQNENPREVRDLSQLESLLRAIEHGVVAFDGCTSAGKTTLMNELTGRLKYPAIDLDQHLNRQRGEFVNALRLSELAAAIQEALQQSPVALIAGVCIREVLDRLQCDTVLHIYVQRNSPMGIPGDLDILDIEDGRQLGDMSLLSELDKEIASYHARYCPRRNADVVYVRTGDD